MTDIAKKPRPWARTSFAAGWVTGKASLARELWSCGGDAVQKIHQVIRRDPGGFWRIGRIVHFHGRRVERKHVGTGDIHHVSTFIAGEQGLSGKRRAALDLGSNLTVGLPRKGDDGGVTELDRVGFDGQRLLALVLVHPTR